ncbi:hypothetical protein IV203_020974 [Nitzschia inconspicua]|uniref:Uncharacterized protein n=1 Tax=Nitzschia inconspicua TaxID=303405 RepID=A0A9K3KGS4_9STRA|nr:hypothetical protein IV203_020974 [Nitzschia inconspicua]
MKLIRTTISVVVISAFSKGHSQVSAWSPSVALTSTSSSLWKKEPSKTTRKNSIPETESTTSIVQSIVIEESTPTTETISNATIVSSKVPTKSFTVSHAIMTRCKQILSSSQLYSAAAVFGGTVLTYHLNNDRNLGPIVASSVVGILSALSLPLPLALASFCGSFAGMAQIAIIPSMVNSIILGIVCAVMMALFDKQKWLIGVGGRLGFIAQCACTLQFLVSSFWKPVASGATIVGSFGDPLSVIRRLPLVCVSILGGALFMSFWKEAMTELVKMSKDNKSKSQFYQRLSNSVAASSVTGLLAGSLLPATLAGPVFCGSFIAMSAPAKLETYGSLIGASIMGGLCQQAMSGVLQGGWGGRLGTASLLGVLSYRFMMSLSKKAKQPARKSA